MPDEFTFAIAKAVLVIASSTGVILFLAGFAAKNCFPETPHARIRGRGKHALSSSAKKNQSPIVIPINGAYVRQTQPSEVRGRTPLDWLTDLLIRPQSSVGAHPPLGL
jgi:hypothetical protein